jgi:hypothetical protein
MSFHCSPSTHANKILLKKKLGELRTRRRKKKGERRKRWIDKTVFHLEKVEIFNQKV